MTTEHTCSKCKRTLAVAQFHKNASKPSGLSAWCKPCRQTRDGANRAGYRKHCVTYRRKKRATKLVGCIRSRARKHGIRFDLDQHLPAIQARIDAGYCELSGIPFDLDASLGFNSPSIDRVDPAAGYVYSNIRVVCFAMNCALNSWGEDVLLHVVRAWLSFRETGDRKE